MITKYTLILVLCFLCHFAYTQELLPTKAIDGSYKALKAEKGPSGLTKDKVIQLAENNGTKMLAVASCEKCYPAMYSYNKALSEEFGTTVFMNSFGILALRYDSESLVVVAPSLKMGENFSFYNFYSKNQTKVSAMSKEEIEKYELPILDLL